MEAALGKLFFKANVMPHQYYTSYLYLALRLKKIERTSDWFVQWHLKLR